MGTATQSSTDTNQGILLGLNSLNELLKSMNDKMDSAEKEREEREKEEELMKARKTFINDVATEVTTLLKEDSGVEKYQVELHGDDAEKQSHEDTLKNGGGIDDAETVATGNDMGNDMDEAQRPMQLSDIAATLETIKKHMLKEHADMYEREEVKDEVMTEPAEEKMAEDIASDVEGDMDTADTVREADHYPETDEMDWDNDDDFDKMYKSLKNNPKAMKEFMRKSLQKQADKKAEDILRQNGFNKSESYMPKVHNKNSMMGIQKSGDEKPEGTLSERTMEIKKQISRSWDELARDYVAFRGIGREQSGILTDEMKELYSNL